MTFLRHFSPFLRRWWLVGLLAAIIILTAPLAGLLRDELLARLGGRFVAVLGGAFALAVLVVAVFTLRRLIAERLSDAWWRWLALGGAAVLVGVQFVGWGSGSSEVDVVERIHILQYGTLALLAYRVWFGEDRKDHDLWHVTAVILTVLLVGTVDEWLQWLSPARVGDYRDVFLNLWAGLCGLLVAVALDPPNRFRWRFQAQTGASPLILFAATIVCFGAYFDCAHLGQWIDDPETGSFRSYFSPESLRQAANERRVSWSTDPPTEIRALSIEDYFLTEGVRHVQQRNIAYEAGHFDEAWSENLILETWFDPVLDVKSFRSGVAHRWPEAQRSEVETRAVATSRYVSPVLKGRIVTRPHRSIFWLSTLGLAGLLIARAVWRRR